MQKMSLARLKMPSLIVRIGNILKKPFLPDRRLYKVGKSLRNAAEDYATVARETAAGLRDSPPRLLTLVVGIGGFTAMWWRNPDMDYYLEEMHAYSNELSQCSELTTNPNAKKYIEHLVLANCQERLLYVSLGVLSLVVERRNEDCANYNVTCRHLQPRWWTFHTSIVDVGVWGRWRVMEKHMVDFDVNEESLRDLRSL